jgi:hypothetical protein
MQLTLTFAGLAVKYVHEKLWNSGWLFQSSAAAAMGRMQFWHALNP